MAEKELEKRCKLGLICNGVLEVKDNSILEALKIIDQIEIKIEQDSTPNRSIPNIKSYLLNGEIAPIDYLRKNALEKIKIKGLVCGEYRAPKNYELPQKLKELGFYIDKDNFVCNLNHARVDTGCSNRVKKETEKPKLEEALPLEGILGSRTINRINGGVYRR